MRGLYSLGRKEEEFFFQEFSRLMSSPPPSFSGLITSGIWSFSSLIIIQNHLTIDLQKTWLPSLQPPPPPPLCAQLAQAPREEEESQSQLTIQSWPASRSPVQSPPFLSKEINYLSDWTSRGRSHEFDCSPCVRSKWLNLQIHRQSHPSHLIALLIH